MGLLFLTAATLILGGFLVALSRALHKGFRHGDWSDFKPMSEPLPESALSPTLRNIYVRGTAR